MAKFALDAVQELFPVELLPSSTYPELVNEDRELLAVTNKLPDSALPGVSLKPRH